MKQFILLCSLVLVLVSPVLFAAGVKQFKVQGVNASNVGEVERAVQSMAWVEKATLDIRNETLTILADDIAAISTDDLRDAVERIPNVIVVEHEGSAFDGS